MPQPVDFQWKCQPEAENLALSILEEAEKLNTSISTLKQELLQHTSTRLFDWIDHLSVGWSKNLEVRLQQVGYELENSSTDYHIFHHFGAQLPNIVLYHKIPIFEVAVIVESIEDFLMVRGINVPILGDFLSGYRHAIISTENGVSLSVVERRGTAGLEPVKTSKDYLGKYLGALHKWQTRPRALPDDDMAMQNAISLAEVLVTSLGQDLAAWIVLDIERRYWQARNRAGQFQKNRQDRLGMGWANHDHHTFRSSRKHFSSLVHLFEILGFHCRERYYAGKEVGWGAQIMENPRCRLVLFLDVDLAPDELSIDFAHEPLKELKSLGTIGLWCALHGDSILKAGMHHLEAQFMFEGLTEDLKTMGVGMMDPFSSFPYLKQAFTVGEIWHVEHAIIDELLRNGRITKEQAEKFKFSGAVGSHLENLQRREGYKGFNQKNVSVIIKKTDPRHL